jgi:LemA protein
MEQQGGKMMARMNGMTLTRRWPAAFVVLAALLLSGCGVNTIPTLDEAVKASWAQVLNQYQRRADLIPNLVETVRGYATQERETLTAVVEARAKATQTQIPPDILTNPEAFQRFQQSQDALSSALSRLMVVVERYPDLKSNQNFLQLQAQLEGTENRIAVARRDYIQSVQRYNTEIRTFPGVIWASLLYRDAKVKENFQAQPGAEQAPRVDFGKKS